MGQGKYASKLGVTTSHRKAMFRTMVTSFLKYEKVRTTDSRARELRRVAEKMVTLGKRGDLHARRQAAAFLREREMVGKLFGEIAERYKDRAGGYTRIVKMDFRAGDNAPMSLVEFVAAPTGAAQKGTDEKAAKKKPQVKKPVAKKPQAQKPAAKKKTVPEQDETKA